MTDKTEIDAKKVQAFDLLKQIAVLGAKARETQRELTQVESEIAKLEEKEDVSDS